MNFMPMYPMQSSAPLKVNGIDGARCFNVRPNDTAVLFDANRDVFYLKTTDAGGYPTITEYEFKKVDAKPAPTTDYISRSEFESLKEELLNVWKQQPKQFSEPDGELPAIPKNDGRKKPSGSSKTIN